MTLITNKKDIVWTLARHIVNTNLEDLSKEAVEVTKKSILDTLGVIATASGYKSILVEDT